MRALLLSYFFLLLFNHLSSGKCSSMGLCVHVYCFTHHEFHYTGFERVYTVTDFLLFDSNELIYFEVFKPDNIKYIFKMRPAKDFGRAFVSFSFSVFWFGPPIVKADVSCNSAFIIVLLRCYNTPVSVPLGRFSFRTSGSRGS